MLFMSMTCDEDPYYNKDFFESDLISIDKKSTYAVNDKLYFNCNFSRYLAEKGFVEKNDIFRTSGSEIFVLPFRLSKKDSENNWKYVPITAMFITENGGIDDAEFVSNALCILNKNTNQYEFRGAYTLSEVGTYKLEINTELRPKTFLNNISVNIKTTVFEVAINKYDQAEYLFSVN